MTGRIEKARTLLNALNAVGAVIIAVSLIIVIYFSSASWQEQVKVLPLINTLLILGLAVLTVGTAIAADILKKASREKLKN